MDIRKFKAAATKCSKYAMVFFASVGFYTVAKGVIHSNPDQTTPAIRMTHISASRSMRQTARRNDLAYLHKVGNRAAKSANLEYTRNLAEKYADLYSSYKTDEAAPMEYMDEESKDCFRPFAKKHRIYKPDKYGNYWSWFEDHPAMLNDVFDIGKHGNAGANAGNITSASASKSGIVANEKVLREHGVHSGVNFAHYYHNDID